MLPSSKSPSSRAPKGAQQIFGPLPASEGKTGSESPGSRFQTDLVQCTFDPSKGMRWALVVLNVMARQLYAEALPSKEPPTVASGLEKTLDRLPERPAYPSSDKWPRVVRGCPNSAHNQEHRASQQGPQDPNAFGALDSKIALLRRTLALSLAKTPGAWSERLATVVAQINERLTSALPGGEAPDEVRDSDVAVIMSLQQNNAEKLKFNRDLLEKRKRRLQNVGAFRRPKTGLARFRRGFRARYGKKEDLDHIDGSRVYGVGSDKLIKIKRAMPVSKRTDSTHHAEVESERQEKKREAVFELVFELMEWLRGEEQEKSLSAAARHFRSIVGMSEYQAAMSQMGHGLSFGGALATSIRIFPDSFRLRPAGTGRGNYYVSPAG